MTWLKCENRLPNHRKNLLFIRDFALSISHLLMGVFLLVDKLVDLCYNYFEKRGNIMILDDKITPYMTQIENRKNPNVEFFLARFNNAMELVSDDELMVCNILRDYPVLVQELKELYGEKMTIEEAWCRSYISVNKQTGKGTYKLDKFLVPPKNRSTYAHFLSFKCDDLNYIKFLMYDIKKKLTTRYNLSFTSEKSVERDEAKTISVELPSFMNFFRKDSNS